jgi:hypothetical protein
VTKRWTLALLALLIATAALAADLPPGKWWRRPDMVLLLGLTADQQTRLDAIWRGASSELIDDRGEVEKQNIALRGELDQPQLDRKNVQRLAARLNEARGRLFERELMMLVDMRGVLTDTQWSRMRAQLDRVQPNARPNLQRRRQQ